jgi:hypothetical protein
MYLCTPALVHLVLSILTVIVLVIQQSFDGIIWNILFSLAWLWFLTILCNRGYVTLAWVLVLLPFIIIGIMLVLILSLISSNPGAGGTVITPTGEVTPVTTEAK